MTHTEGDGHEGGRADVTSPRDRERFYRTALENAPIGVALVTLDGSFLQVNAALCHILGYSESDLRATRFQALTHPDDLELDLSLRQSTLRGEVPGYCVDKRYRRGDDSVVWAQLDVVLVRDDDDAPLYFIAQVQDISARKAAESRLSDLALHDPLTGLPNRLLFHDRATQALRRRHGGGSLAVGFVDLDDFKLVNETRGHCVGDDLLVQVAHRLESVMRAGDTVARFGGDEFVLLLGDVADDAEVQHRVQRTLAALGPPFTVAGEEVPVSASAGLVLAPGGADVDDLLRYADLAMFEAKRRGKNQLSVYRAELETAALDRVHTERELRVGLVEDGFFPVYQPVVDLVTGAIDGVESLARWQRGTEVVDAIDFIGVADSSGLLTELSDVLFAAVADDVAALRIGDGRYVIVNVVAPLLTAPQVISRLEALAEASGAPERLVIEMAETDLLELHGSAARALTALRAAGLRFSLDDFGVGYSALSMLASFEPDILKVDQIFVSRLGERVPSAIVEAVCDLADRLGIATVAEGIETPDQLVRLRDIGCRAGQGYLLGRPVPASELRGRTAVALPA